MGYISRLTCSLAVLKQEMFDMVINGQANYTYHPNLQTIHSHEIVLKYIGRKFYSCEINYQWLLELVWPQWRKTHTQFL